MIGKNVHLISDQEEAIESFRLIAEELFNSYILITDKSREYRLQEIEFYLYSENHPDTTSHRGERQKMRDQWYVHRFGKKLNSGYATFSSKVGLDMVFSGEDYILSILIRGIYDLKNNRLISGPIKVLNDLYGKENSFILGSNNYVNYIKYSEIVESMGLFDEKNPIHLKKTKNLIEKKPEFSARTGLNAKKHGEFANRLYKGKII